MISASSGSSAVVANAKPAGSHDSVHSLQRELPAPRGRALGHSRRRAITSSLVAHVRARAPYPIGAGFKPTSLSILRARPWRRPTRTKASMARSMSSGRVHGGELHAYAGFAFGHDRVAETDDVHPLIQHIAGHLGCQPGVADHDGHDGVVARPDGEARRRSCRRGTGRRWPTDAPAVRRQPRAAARRPARPRRSAEPARSRRGTAATVAAADRSPSAGTR